MPRRKPEPRRPGLDHLDDETDLTETARYEIVAEAAQTFGEEVARELATLLRVPFDACQLETHT